MADVRAPSRSRRIREGRFAGGRHVVRHAIVALTGFTLLGLACVDLTPPPEVEQYRKGTGGFVGTGGSGEGGTGPQGGAPATGGVAGGGGVPSTGGVTAAGGVAGSPDSGGIAGVDGGAPDVPQATGGAGGTGGGVGVDGAAETGGSAGAGGLDGGPGTGGTVPDAAGGAGGGPGTGGVTGSGGVEGTGGTTVATGGVTTTGGTTATGGTTGTGGTTATGGTTGTGGTTATGGSTGYQCASPVVPASGVVTDFTDWDATTRRWGSGSLTGTLYAYADTATSATMSFEVEGTPPGLHLTGSLGASSSWGGGGLTFLACVSVASFTEVSFDVYGGASGCQVELQLQTFDQRPNDQTPPGGCVKATDGSGCYKFPLKSQVVDLGTTLTTPRTVSVTLSSMSNWAASAATQIVGIQWQFTGTCSPSATFTNIKFVP